jgi:LCP family protein required for cell wall assembly
MSRSTGSPLRAFLGRFVISLVVASLVVTAVVVVANREINDRIAKIPRIQLALASPPPGGANFLLIGSDTRAFVDNPADATQFGDAQSQGGQRSDTIMVAHVEPGSQRTFVVSFPRDLMVNIPGYGRQQINAAYSLGGPQDGAQLLIDTLDANFGIKINHYLAVDFKSFRSVVETIGQVWVYIPGKMRDQYSGLSTPYGAGCFPLNGDAALSYVRARHLEIADPNGPIVDADGTRWRQYDVRADLDRIPRQQSFIRRLAGLAISKSLGDPFLAIDLADNVLHYLTVDQALGRDEVNALVKAFRTVNVNDPNSLQMVTLPVVADPNDANRVIPADAADGVIAALNTFGASTPKALPAPSQVTVDVVDGSGLDLGAGIVNALADQGFKVRAQGSSAPVTVSEIHYAPNQLAAAESLLAYLPDAKLVPDRTATKAVKVVVGSDFVNLTVPSTTTTVPGHAATSTVAPTTTAPPTTTLLPTTTTTPFDQPCPQN